MTGGIVGKPQVIVAGATSTYVAHVERLLLDGWTQCTGIRDRGIRYAVLTRQPRGPLGRFRRRQWVVLIDNEPWWPSSEPAAHQAIAA